MSPGTRTPAWTRPDVLSGLALVAVALFAWTSARGLPFGTLYQPGPGFFPRSLAVLTGVLAALLVLRGALADAPAVGSLWPDRGGVRRILVMLGALLSYAWALEPAGYLLSTAGLFLILLRGVGRRSWPVTGVVAALAAAGSYLLFARWLMVSLPPGLWAP